MLSSKSGAQSELQPISNVEAFRQSRLRQDSLSQLDLREAPKPEKDASVVIFTTSRDGKNLFLHRPFKKGAISCHHLGSGCKMRFSRIR